MTNLQSHEYAGYLKELAEFLLSKPNFKTDLEKAYLFIHVYKREELVAAVKALGAGTKEFKNDDFHFKATTSEHLFVRVDAPRNIVCRMVKPAEYDCEPILTPDEVAAL